MRIGNTRQDRAQRVRDAWWTRDADDAEIISNQEMRRARSDVERATLRDLIEAQRRARERRERGEL